MSKDDEKEVRDIVKAAVEKEFSRLVKDFDKKVDKFLTKQDFKDLLKKAFIKQNKYMWEKSAFFTQFINTL